MGRSRGEGAGPLSQEGRGQMPPGVLSVVAPRAGKQPLCFRNPGVAATGSVGVRDGGKLI